ncbi:MAG: hypothetical protein H7Y86_21565 [Rhizobacter sp.]|nr:hypothetical protein [Ferruginibacter sp.]
MNIFSVFNEFVVIGLALLLLLIAAIMIRKSLRRKNALRLKTATGIILSVEKLALAKEHHVEVKLLVMVMPDKSRNFVGELIETVLLTDLLAMKIGDRIPVEYSNNYKLMLGRAG